jgi:hypothetical protein
MTWQERLKIAAFTSPSGVRTEFFYENVRANINKRDSLREPADFDGAFVQNFGIGASSYPMLCIFWGDDHDRDADAFLNLLVEPGTGMLEHPLYGRIENAVSFGPVARRDDLKTAANQTVFEVNFVQSARFSFPGSITAIEDEIGSAIGEFEDAQGAAFEDDIKIATAREKISLIDSVKTKVANVQRSMSKIAATVDEIQNEFNDAVNFINNNINSLVGTPLKLANSVINLVKSPARAASQISATLSAYGNLLASVISDANGLFSPTAGNSVNNQFFNSELFSRAAFASMLTGSTSAAGSTREVSGQSLEDFISLEPQEQRPFSTQTEIIETIEFLGREFVVQNDWNEANRASLTLLDTGEAFSYLERAWSLTAGFLIQLSFSARQERIIVLSEPRNFVELCGELYGTLDAAFDFFILTNDLTGDEIYELPRGRRVKYYI